MRGSLCAAFGSAHQQGRRGGKNVLDLGERYERDECESEKPVKPPERKPQNAAAVRRQARRGEAFGDGRAHGRPPTGIPHIRPRLKPDQPRGLQEIAGEADDEQRPEKGPVLAPVLGAEEIRIAGRAVGSRIVELGQLHPAAPIHHIEQPAEQRDAGNVEHQGEDQIELALPEADSEQGLEDVVLQGDGGGAEEQQAETVEDQAMRAAGRVIPAIDGAMAQDLSDHVAGTGPEAPLEGDGGAAPVFTDLDVHAPTENADGGIAQCIKKPHLGRRKCLE